MNDNEKNQRNAVISDGEWERNEHPIGKVVHLSTVTHAFRGTLLAVTPSYYVLDDAREVTLVDSTGAFGEYLGTLTAGREGDTYHPKKTKNPTLRILRGAVSWCVSAP